MHVQFFKSMPYTTVYMYFNVIGSICQFIKLVKMTHFKPNIQSRKDFHSTLQTLPQLQFYLIITKSIIQRCVCTHTNTHMHSALHMHTHILPKLVIVVCHQIRSFQSLLTSMYHRFWTSYICIQLNNWCNISN